ncbi:MAG: ion transporter [Caulobacterales bacterium 32-69-10]|nr:MAG: ion transporter [Caulobacterales bacterium 32-69-10]
MVESSSATHAVQPGDGPGLRARLHRLYYGRTPAAVRFRYSVLVLDLAIIAFFIAAPMLRGTEAFFLIDYAIAVVVAVEMVARVSAAYDSRWWRAPIVWVDIFVLATLLVPQVLFNLGFLRIVRLWSVVHSEFFWRTVGRRYDDTRWEDVIRTVATMVTFVFVVTGFVYTSYARTHPGIDGYVDALYFTVATLTTTGFGDITLPGTWGKLISIVTMIAGITLFVRLAQALFRPYKVSFACPTCGLMRHDQDAVHCKACGEILNIPNDEH